MAQETNLNVAPYYDDFDPAKDYHKILFKPGQPVQARELTGLQSVLQNQVSKFGEHFFKEGSSVIPGQLSYFSNFYCIQVEENFLDSATAHKMSEDYSLLKQKFFPVQALRAEVVSQDSLLRRERY